MNLIVALTGLVVGIVLGAIATCAVVIYKKLDDLEGR